MKPARALAGYCVGHKCKKTDDNQICAHYDRFFQELVWGAQWAYGQRISIQCFEAMLSEFPVRLGVM